MKMTIQNMKSTNVFELVGVGDPVLDTFSKYNNWFLSWFFTENKNRIYEILKYFRGF